MRLVIVSNRLPFTIKEDRGEVTFAPSDGGLASGLRTYLDALPDTANDITDYLWIGWPGAALDDPTKARLAPLAETERRAKMVHLTNEQIESFYHGFCNATIWPLFHYFVSFAKFEDAQWEEYRAINEVFADAVAATLQPNDVVWVHDYHLMLLPRLLRERFPNQSIGFFLHIPFPSVEVFRLLPTDWRRALLEGMLGADLIGFHTDEYVQHFEDALQRVLSCDVQNHQVQYLGSSARIAAHPMGIDYLRFAEATRDDPEVTAERERLLALLNGRRMILSLDRLDYTKGILHRLHAYRTFLEENPDRRGSIVLLLNVVPSRGVVADYRVFKQQLEQLISTINGEFGDLEWTPILYQYRTVLQSALIALYSVADIALVTPLRDGMNLVAKEYVASRRDNTGVLILSELAGAARDLTGAIIVNPNDAQEVARAIVQALDMPKEEQALRNANMRRQLQENDVSRWGARYLATLREASAQRGETVAASLKADLLEKATAAYRDASRRLLFLDYDGTLVPFADTPGRAWPDAELVQIIQRLTADPKNEVVIASGRSRHDLEYWFGDLDLNLAAEHGLWMRDRGHNWRATVPVVNQWRDTVRRVLEAYVERLPRSFIEEKEGSLVWHYRMADPNRAPQVTAELSDELLRLSKEWRFQVVFANKVVEVSNEGVNKGNVGANWLDRDDWDFVFAVGDDWPDEQLFSVMPMTAFTVGVGRQLQSAAYRLRDYRDTRELLSAFTAIAPESDTADAARPDARAARNIASTRVLVVDDDPGVLSGLRRAFALEGYDVLTAPDGETALAIAEQTPPDMVVLDLLLPGIDGLTVCQRLRQHTGAPIIILSARDTLPDRVAGLDRGADDYLVKPFALDELLARVRALLRRSNHVPDTMLEYRDLRMDTRTHEVFRNNQPVHLTAREFDLLRLFLRHPRQVLTREQISQQVWGYAFDGESNFVDAAVKELRKKIEGGGAWPRLIQTVRGYGYALREG